MTDLPTLSQFRAIRDAHALAFCEQEIATYTPIEAALAKEVRAVIARYKRESDRNRKKELEDEIKRTGYEWQDASARVNAARAMYEVLTNRKRLEDAA